MSFHCVVLNIFLLSYYWEINIFTGAVTLWQITKLFRFCYNINLSIIHWEKNIWISEMERQLNSLHFYIKFMFSKLRLSVEKSKWKTLIFFIETRSNDNPSDPRHVCEIHYLPSESESVASLHPSCWHSSRTYLATVFTLPSL